MKTYLVTSQTNYGTTIHVVNADSKEQAVELATKASPKKHRAWPGASAQEINTTRRGVVLIDFARD